MKTHALKKITAHLESVLEVLNANGLADSKIRPRYAEYYVAHAFSENGHHPTILDERERTSADICIKGTGKRIEVKSGKQDDEWGWAYASFTGGQQMEKEKFDYCVFVVFDKQAEGRIREIFAFTPQDLRSVTQVRKGFAAHESNQCLLSRAIDYDDYVEKMEGKFPMTPIEKDLNRH